jgi:hypothetical protein
MIATAPTFIKFKPANQLSVKKSYITYHENLTNSLAADARSQADRWTGSPHNKFFFHCVKNAKVYELHFKDITVLLVMYMLCYVLLSVYQNLQYTSHKVNCSTSQLTNIAHSVIT